MDINHPVAIKMFEFGCTNQKKILLAFQTYIELCEAYALRDVDYHYNKELDLIYISSKESTGKRKLYIPVNIADSITLTLISEWQSKLINEDNNTELFVSLRDSTTTAVYYKLSKGFTAPLSLEAAQTKKSQQDTKDFTRNEICKSRHRLYQQAKEEKNKRLSVDSELEL